MCKHLFLRLVYSSLGINNCNQTFPITVDQISPTHQLGRILAHSSLQKTSTRGYWWTSLHEHYSFKSFHNMSIGSAIQKHSLSFALTAICLICLYIVGCYLTAWPSYSWTSFQGQIPWQFPAEFWWYNLEFIVLSMMQAILVWLTAPVEINKGIELPPFVHNLPNSEQIQSKQFGIICVAIFSLVSIISCFVCQKSLLFKPLTNFHIPML